MRVLIASRAFDAVDGPRYIDPLETAGCAVTELRGLGLNDDAVSRELAGHDVLLIGAEAVTCAAMCAAPELRLIVRTGKGIDNIAADYPRVPELETCDGSRDANTRAVAEYAVLGMLAALRHAASMMDDVRVGVWSKRIGRELWKS
jgi:phosphoglycerate dehydrogenase-like enzyme